MKKLLLSMMLLAGIVGCGNESTEESKELVVGLSGDYPPFEFHKMIDGEDTIVGFDVMLAEEIAADLGLELVISEMEFDGLVGALQAGHVDMVISGMTPNEERINAVDFSDLYYTGEQAVLVRSDEATTYTTTDSLASATVGVQLGSIQSPLAKELSESVTELAKTQDLVLELQNENVDAVIVGKEIAARYAEEFEGVSVSDIVIDSEEGMAVAMPKGSDAELIEQVNGVIEDLKTSGKLDEMLEEATNLMNE